jgi:hypothetical protein
LFPIAPQIVVLFWAAAAIAGMVAGLLSGFLFARVFKLKKASTWMDALLGGIGVFVGFIAAIRMPWPENTVTAVMNDGNVVQTTMNQFQHPFLVAYVFAVVLPAIHQLYRLRQLRQKSQLITKGS